MTMVVYQGTESYSPSVFEDDTYKNIDLSNTTTRSYAGLRNQGATCYLNSVIQTLFMTPEFRSAIFSWKYDESKDGPEDTCIPLQLQKLFGYLQLSNRKSADTVGLTTSFGWTGRDVFQQQDVQELFRVLFDALEEAFKDTPLRNIIDQIYAGEMIDYVRCIDIDYESERADKFLDLSFAIIPFGKRKALSSLYQCIKMYLRPEVLDGENQYYAEPVEHKVDAIKGIKVRRLPYIMTIQLKRFVFDFSGDNIVQKKINDVVKFPMILDMNRYVSKKRRAQSLVSAEDIEDRDVTTDEFEEFLQEQMTILREKKVGLKHDGSKELGPNSPNTETVDLEEEDNNHNDNGHQINNGHSNNNNNNNHHHQVNNIDSNEEEEDLDAIEHMPSLVDSMGNKSPDQLLEEKLAKETELFETHGLSSRQELLQLVENRGEWIYELYAVLIHSGAITGGHYYAYIKDLNSLKWYNFNDSNVTEIFEKDVQEAWGKVISSSMSNYGPYQSNYTSWQDINSYGSASYGNNVYGDSYLNSFYGSSPNRPSSSLSSSSSSSVTFSGANAYMLMYRKVCKDASIEIGIDGIGSQFPSDDVIPDYIHEAVKKENEEYMNKLREEEERRKQMNISFYWKRELNTINVKTTDTLVSLLDKLWKRWNLIYEKEFEDLLQEARNKYHLQSHETITDGIEIPCPYDRIRLRSYLVNSGLKHDVYETTGKFDLRTLSDHNIANYKQFTVDIRGIDEEFDEYICGGIVLLIHAFQTSKGTYSDAIQISVKANSTIYELKQKIHNVFSKKKLITYPIEKMRILKAQRSYNMRPPSIDILDNNQLTLFDGYRITLQDKLFVEEYEPPPAYGLVSPHSTSSIEPIASEPSISYSTSSDIFTIESPGYQVLYNTLFELRIFHTIPFKSHPCYDNNQPTTPMVTDSRWVVSKLREEIAKVLTAAQSALSIDSYDRNEVIDKTRVRLFLQFPDGREFRTDNELRQEGIYEGAKIYVVIGPVPPPNHFVLKFSLYIPRSDDGVTRRDQYIHNLHSLAMTETLSKTITKTTVNVNHENSSNESNLILPPDPPSSHIPSSSSSSSSSTTNKRIESTSGEECDSVVDKFVEKLSIYRPRSMQSKAFQVIEDANYDGSHSDNDDKPTKWYTSGNTSGDLKTNRSITKHKNSSSSDKQKVAIPEGNISTSLPLEKVESETKKTISESNTNQDMSSSSYNNTEIEPSNFAAVMISNEIDKSELTSLPIENIFANDDTKVDDIRSQLATELLPLLPTLIPQTILDFLDLVTVNPDKNMETSYMLPKRRIRIRESSDCAPGRIVRDGATFKQQGLYISPGKPWVIQILTKLEADNEESLHPIYENIDTQVTVMKWIRRSWSLSEKTEYLLRGELTVQQLCMQLGAIYGIHPVENIRTLLIKSHNKIHLSDLNQQIIRDIYRSWSNHCNELRKLKDLSNLDFKLRNGDILLIQDVSEPLKELTREDMLSLQYVEEASRSIYGNSNYSYGGRYDSFKSIGQHNHTMPITSTTALTQNNSNSNNSSSSNDNSNSINNNTNHMINGNTDSSSYSMHSKSVSTNTTIDISDNTSKLNPLTISSPIGSKSRLSSPNSPAVAPVGIRIRTNKDRQKQHVPSEPTPTESTNIHRMNGMNDSDNVHGGNSTTNNSEDHRIISEEVLDHSSNQKATNHDEIEFVKQGGIALFSDISEV